MGRVPSPELGSLPSLSAAKCLKWKFLLRRIQAIGLGLGWVSLEAKTLSLCLSLCAGFVTKM